MNTHNHHDCGVDGGKPFCMAFVFTKNGTVVVTGSLQRIQSHCESWDPAHAIVHTYLIDQIEKQWIVVGHSFLCLVYTKNVKTMGHADSRKKWLKPLIHDLRHNYWLLCDMLGQKILAKWRILPSCHLKQFEGRLPDPISYATPQRAGLDSIRPHRILKGGL